jgi:hypothetical protein
MNQALLQRIKKEFIQVVYQTNLLLKKQDITENELNIVRSSVNSYLGLLKHYKTYNIRKKNLTE